MTPETHDKFTTAMALLRGVSRRLSEIEDGLSVVGMEKLSGRVSQMNEDSCTALQLVNEAVGESISDMVRASGEATQNMIGAVLAISAPSAP